jgi:hypothetical protein
VNWERKPGFRILSLETERDDPSQGECALKTFSSGDGLVSLIQHAVSGKSLYYFVRHGTL